MNNWLYTSSLAENIESAFKAVVHERMKRAPNLEKAVLKDSLKFLHSNECVEMLSKSELEYLMDEKVIIIESLSISF